MLYEESIWVGKTILKLNNEIKTLLNLGSSSLVIRTEVQPHMEKFVFSPIREGGIKVVHTDIQNISGVDIVGDFTDTIFVNELKQNKYDAILCSNLFEHLTELNTIVNAINLIVPQNGYLILTVPFHYPYHLDPIDTKYRPRISELQKLFPDFKYVDGNEIEAQRVELKTIKIILNRIILNR